MDKPMDGKFYESTNRVKGKCKQYWNESVILPEEVHSILGYIFENVVEAEVSVSRHVAEAVKKAVEDFRERACNVCEKLATVDLDIEDAVRALPLDPEPSAIRAGKWE